MTPGPSQLLAIIRNIQYTLQRYGGMRADLIIEGNNRQMLLSGGYWMEDKKTCIELTPW